MNSPTWRSPSTHIYGERRSCNTPVEPTRLWRTFIASLTLVFDLLTPSATRATTSRTRVPTSALQSQPSLGALMGHTHARVSNLEAATAKNEADFATTMNALAATTAAHATTATAVAEIGTTVTDAVDDLVGPPGHYAWEAPSTRCTAPYCHTGGRWYRPST